MNVAILVFIGGAFGAICREILMVIVPKMNDQFPLDIFIANIIASFLLGITAALLANKKIGQAANAFIATGVMGGLSTFSSFMYGAVEVMNNPQHFWVGIFYLAASIILGFIVVFMGYGLGAKCKPSRPA